MSEISSLNGLGSRTKRAWRYRVTASGGCLAEQCPPGTFLLEWENKGDEYDWNVYDFRKGEQTGFASGVLVGTGWIVDDKFKADPQKCMACGKRRKVAGWWHSEADDPALDPVCSECGGAHAS
jgi:hypothetical protein